MKPRRERMGRIHWIGLILPLLVAVATQVLAEPVDSSNLPPAATSQVDFVRDIQPLLAQHCYGCHGPDKQENDLRWDVKSAALKGGTSGLAVVPGRSAESRMIRLVAELEKDQIMPKKGDRLTPQQIGLLRAWIDQGADWPADTEAAHPVDKTDWWSFQPASRPSLPKVRNQNWVRNPIDQFVLATLEANEMSPSPEADRRTLIRRLSFDLTGLPPTPEEVGDFLRAKGKRAYEELVDRLLASPRYGERWARHWLDTVHYGETHGYDKDKPRLNAWPYRDYVIRSLNQDKPYPRFVEEQLAGDILFPTEPEGVVALGFLAAGPWDFVGHVELPIQKTDGLIARYNDRDDMVMTTISTFQSLTVHCARCHDHKFDPISQRDYYSLQAVFAGVDRADRAFDSDQEVARQRHSLVARMKPLADRYALLSNQVANITSPEVRELDARLIPLRSQRDRFARAAAAGKSPGNGYHSEIAANADTVKWVQIDLGQSRPLEAVGLMPARPVDYPDTPGFGFPVRFRVETSTNADFNTPEMITDQTAADFKNPGDHLVLFSASKRPARFVRLTATRLWQRTQDYVLALAEMQVFAGGTNLALGSSVSALDSIEAGTWSKQFLVDDFDSRHKLGDPLAPEKSTDKEILEAEIHALIEKRAHLIETLTDETTRNQLTLVTNELDQITRQLAALPPMQKVYAAGNEFKPEGSFQPAKTPRPVHLLGRGDVNKPGDLMAAAGIASVPGPNPRFAIADATDEGARRAALARWLTDPKNLLTRRSIVNRVWLYHFGRGLVETPNDFGHMGARPSHPELLDWLAFWFSDHGESLKQLHRLMVTSAVYRQCSANNSEFARLDSDNRFLWRMNRTRLDAETVHDSMLFISGKLDLTMGGPAVQQFYFKDDHSPVYDYTQFAVDSPAGCRRSIYRFLVRSVPDPLMDSLDCPDASILTPKRSVTVTALQALAILNNPFVLKQCELLAARVAPAGKVRTQIEQIYQLALNRRPTATEIKAVVPFAQKNGMASVSRLIFNTSEFMFAD